MPQIAMTQPLQTSPLPANAIILLAHGARDAAWAEPIHRVRAEMLAQCPECPVALAFLEFMEPDLPRCVTDLYLAGHRQQAVVPMFIAQGGHLKRDIPSLIADLQARYPDLQLTLHPAVGEAPEVTRAMAAVALAVR